MLVSCPRCGKIHERGKCSIKKTLKPKMETAASAFRNRKAWRQVREQVRELDSGMCVYCRSMGMVTIERLSVHHIVPLLQDETLGLDVDNLITLCAIHHAMADRGRIDANELRELIVRFRAA